MPVALHHEDGGPSDGPPLLLGPSLGTTLRMWDRQVETLRIRRRVVTFDHRGHGRSPVPGGLYDIDDLAGDVLKLMDRLGIARASWAGSSLGGMVGMWLAIHAPERIDRLVLLCTSAFLPPPEAWEDRAALVLQAGSVEPIADGVVARWLTPAYAAAHPQLRDELRAMLAGQPPAGYAECCRAIGRMDQRHELRTIGAPTLVVSAAEDEATPPAHQQLIAESISGARLVTLSPAAHLAPVERAADVTALITEHLDRDAAP